MFGRKTSGLSRKVPKSSSSADHHYLYFPCFVFDIKRLFTSVLRFSGDFRATHSTDLQIPGRSWPALQLNSQRFLDSSQRDSCVSRADALPPCRNRLDIVPDERIYESSAWFDCRSLSWRAITPQVETTRERAPLPLWQWCLLARSCRA